MRIIKTSEKKQKLISEYHAKPLQVGDKVYVKHSALYSYSDMNDEDIHCLIIGIKGNKLMVNQTDRPSAEMKKINIDDVVKKDIRYIGANPFGEKEDHIRPVAFTLESILFNLSIVEQKTIHKPFEINGIEIKDFNWNPFIYDKSGSKQYYQRPFVWTIADNQLLIDSIYNGVDCGRILIRKRSFKELKEMQADGETELAFNDIVDGKQRLNAVKLFILDEYPDSNGNYYSDLSHYAQHIFTGHQLFSYSEMPENTRDSDVLHQFLKLNFTGVPQSKDHINFVKSLREKL